MTIVAGFGQQQIVCDGNAPSKEEEHAWASYVGESCTVCAGVEVRVES